MCYFLEVATVVPIINNFLWSLVCFPFGNSLLINRTDCILHMKLIIIGFEEIIKQNSLNNTYCTPTCNILEDKKFESEFSYSRYLLFILGHSCF